MELLQKSQSEDSTKYMTLLDSIVDRKYIRNGNGEVKTTVRLVMDKIQPLNLLQSRPWGQAGDLIFAYNALLGLDCMDRLGYAQAAASNENSQMLVNSRIRIPLNVLI